MLVRTEFARVILPAKERALVFQPLSFEVILSRRKLYLDAVILLQAMVTPR